MDVALLSAVDQLAFLREGRISVVELAEEHIRRIESIDPLLNAFVDFDADRVRQQARENRDGRLSGLCVTVKSSIEVAGHRCEIGSLLRRGTVATSDAEAVARLRREGAIILGTTNCPEFLMAYETDNLLDGRTNNPGTRVAVQVDRAAERQQRLQRGSRQRESGVTAADPCVSRRTSRASAL